MKHLSAFIIYTLLYVCSIQAQKPIPPMDIPMYMSGNFGELRNNHFHSGIDIKIQGKIGEPIKSIKEGYVSRINISPWGYGKALYVDHPDGTTSVYAHLDRLAKKIEQLATDSQYVRQVFSINLYPDPGALPVKQGEVIGFGGNSGSSGGPHLHFELRETITEEPHDPLVLYKDRIRDTRKPEFKSFMIYPEAGEGVVNGRKEKQMLSFVTDKASKKTTLSPATIRVWGKLGFAVRAYDYMNNTHNTFGVKEVILKIDNQTVFHSDITHFSFSDTRYLNSFIDWEEWEYKKSFYMKSFIEPGNRLKIYRTTDSGIYDFNEERKYSIAYTLRDLYGNTSTYTFTVEGKRQEIPAHIPQGEILAHDREHLIERDGVSLTIPEGNLYRDTDFKFGIIKNFSPYSSYYQLGERMPLHSHCPLTIEITNDVMNDKRKYGILSSNQKKITWVGGTYNEGVMTANVRELGNYYVDVDTIPPKIVAQGQANWTKTKNISFKVTDNLSGINSWHATIGGQFVLFEFDAKRNHLFCKYDPKRMKAGRNTLRLEVADAAGNTAVFESSVLLQ